MQVTIRQLLAGARAATGLTVVIDVFRAFSTACYIVNNGAMRISPAHRAETAFALRQTQPDYLLVGEAHGQKLPGFDYGNSPTEIEHIDFSGRTVVHRSSAGTQGLVNARQATEIITGSFCNAEAIVRYIQGIQPEQVSLVCMGMGTLEPADEDTLCAEYIRAKLAGEQPDFAAIRTRLRDYHSAAKFFDPAITWAPERDFELCLSLNRFDFVLRLECNQVSHPALWRIDVPPSV